MRELPSPIVTIRSDPECRSFPRLPWVARQQQRGKGGSHGQANETGCARCGAGGPRRRRSRSSSRVPRSERRVTTALRIRSSRTATRRVRTGPPTRAARRSTGATFSGYNDGRISITRRSVVNGIDSIDWVARRPTASTSMAVIVKGGDGAYVYFYNTARPRRGSGDLAPPLNGGGQAPQISHAEFCFDPKDAPNPVLSVEKSASGASQITHSWAVDKQVKPAGAADSAYGDNTVLNLPDGGQRLRHVEGDGHALAGADLRRERHDHRLERRRGRGDRRRRLRLDPGCRDRLRRPAAAPASRCRRMARSTATTPSRRAPRCRTTRRPHVGLRTAPQSDTATIQWAAPTEVGTPATVVDDGRRGRDDRHRRPHERRVDDDVQRAVDVLERQAVAEQRPHEHGGRHVERRVGQRQRERPGRLRQDAAASSAASAASAPGWERVDGPADREGRDAAGAARERPGGHRVLAGRQEQRPEPGAQRRGLGRGAERRHVPRGHDPACGRQLHRHLGAARLQPRHARPGSDSDDRALRSGDSDGHVRQLRDGHR